MGDFLAQLQDHLGALKDGSATGVDADLLEKCSIALPWNLSRTDLAALVQSISAVAPVIPYDPTALNKLLIVLIEPFSFSDILSLSDNIDFVAGLDTKALPYNRLLLAILLKATYNASDAATIAGRPEVVAALVTLWLTTIDSGVADESRRVIWGLLKVDHRSETYDNAAGQGLVWKRIFQDRDVYSLFFSICTQHRELSQHDLSLHQQTVAQSRLLDILPLMASLDVDAVTKSHDTETEQKYSPGTSAGLLGFACLHMIATKDDVLMHKCLVEFYSTLIGDITDSKSDTTRNSSVTLDFLISSGVHEETIDFYVDPDENRYGSLEVQFLYSSTAHYVSTYASTYPEHFAQHGSSPRVTARLQKALNLSPGQWAHQESPKHDLNVLVSLPRTALLPSPEVQDRAGAIRPSVISLLPTKQTSADALNALATIFKGPSKIESLTFPESSPMMSSIDEKGTQEAQAARALYYLYITRYNPFMFSDLVAHAESVALSETALGAISVLRAIIDSHWAPLPDVRRRGMLSEPDLLDLLPSPPPATPNSGPLAIIAPPSMEHTLPYLIKPSRSFANLVGGRGDTDSVAYKVAIAKYHTLKALYQHLQEVADTDPGVGYEQILRTLQRPLARGWSAPSEVGGHVATMDL